MSLSVCPSVSVCLSGTTCLMLVKAEVVNLGRDGVRLTSDPFQMGHELKEC